METCSEHLSIQLKVEWTRVENAAGAKSYVASRPNSSGKMYMSLIKRGFVFGVCIFSVQNQN